MANEEQKRSLRITFNSPVILTFACLSLILYVIALAWPSLADYLIAPGDFKFTEWSHYLGLFAHPLVHKTWAHLLGNMMLFMLIGPIMEEKYGSRPIFFMIILTALFTGLMNAMIFTNGAYGASAIIFMLILLVSFTNSRAGEIPVTFLIISALYVGQEILNAFQNDNISQFGHLLGGVCGAFFGFFLIRTKYRQTAPGSK